MENIGTMEVNNLSNRILVGLQIKVFIFANTFNATNTRKCKMNTSTFKDLINTFEYRYFAKYYRFLF